jgi:hypothetical protein
MKTNRLRTVRPEPVEGLAWASILRQTQDRLSSARTVINYSLFCQSHSELRAHTRIVFHQSDIGLEARALREFVDALE